jgi:hypothetical protein
MAKPKDLIAVDVHTEDVGDYNVTEPGWYAVDDGGKVVLGPFVSLAECDRAIRDRKRLTGVKGLLQRGCLFSSPACGGVYRRGRAPKTISQRKRS